MKKFFKVAGIIFGGLIGLIIVVYIILNIVFSIQLHNKIAELKKQGRPTTIAEIIPPPVPDEENAAILYNKAFVLMTTGEGGKPYLSNKIGIENNKIKTIERIFFRKDVKSLLDISEWTDEERKEISTIIKSKELQDIYELLEEGSKKPKCNFNPPYDKGSNMILQHLAFIRDSMRLLYVKAILELESGDVKEAFDTFLVGLKISNHLKNEPILLSQSVRIGCDNIIIEGIENMSDIKGIPVENAKLIINELSTHTGVEYFIKSVDGERIVGMGWAFERLLNGKMTLRDFIYGDPEFVGDVELPLKIRIILSLLSYIDNPIIKKVYFDYLTFLSNIQDSYNLPYYKVAEELKAEKIPRSFIRGYGLINSYLLRKSTISYKANIEICRTGLALKIYKAKNGAYPGTLGFLSEIPIDPFSGKELIYKKSGNGFVLYSLGPNIVDDGGISQTEKIIQLQSLQEPIKTPDGRSLKPQIHPNSAKDYDIVWKCEK